MKKATLAMVLLFLLGGAYLLGASTAQRGGPIPTARKVLYYVDPMNPALKSDKPGLAPCGMELVPVYDDGTPGGGGQPGLPAGVVQVSPDGQQLIGVRLGRVEKAPGTRILRALGRVALDETRIVRLTVPVEGLVREAGAVVTGDLVRKDQVLGTFYNRDFLTAQQTYLYALNTMDRFQGDKSEDQLKLTRAQLQAAEENLEFLGMSKTQLAEVARSRQIARSIELRSPVAGLVVARSVFSGLRFDRSSELYRIADLSQVWILADAFDDEAESLKPGTGVMVSLRNKHATFRAKVSNVLPQFDGTTRTLKVRLEVDNPGLALRPDMFVDVEVPIHFSPALTVAADAVLDSGTRQIVFVDRGGGAFESRQVEIGWRSGDRVEIRSGLQEGERIAVAGTFLLDSESRMRSAASGAPDRPRHDRSVHPAMETAAVGGRHPDGHAHDAHAAERMTPVAHAFGVARDPSCGKEVDMAAAAASGLTIEDQGTTYYFSSEDCKQQFSSDPTRSTAAGPPAGPRSHRHGGHQL
jgi:membrane fusion protein, copper/silver efflux system